MATRVAWWLNLDAPLELEHPSRYARPTALHTRISALVERMLLLLWEGDVILAGPAPARTLPVACALTFCPTPSALEALEALGFARGPTSSLETLRALTSRSFAASLGQTLPGAHYVRSFAELRAHLERKPSITNEWLIKRDFSFAARQRRRVRGETLDAPTLGFVKRSFALGQGLQIEPYVERLADFALHGYALADRTLLFGPIVLQHCDARGTWQASEFAPHDALATEEKTLLSRAAQQAGEALVARGYTGPFGIDAFRYRTPSGVAAFQPRSEINVRFSMGYPRVLLEEALASGKAQVHPKM